MNHIDTLYEENRAVLEFLEAQKEISLRASLDSTFKKVFVVAAASFFEAQIQEILLGFCGKVCDNHESLMCLIKTQAVDRKYHTYFDWNGSSANRFFAMFGQTFADRFKAEIQSDESLRRSVKAFLELGRLRNELVHIDFGMFVLDKTSEEVYRLYEAGLRFVEHLRVKLEDSKTTLR